MKKSKTKNIEKSEEQDFSLSQAEQYGIDIQALKDNLNRSYKERMVRHQIALKTIKKFYNKANE